MASYQIPPDTKEREKIIGGVLDWFQFFWILAGFIIGLVLAFILFVLTNSIVLSVILAILGIASTTPFAFIKKLDMPLFTYLMRKRSLEQKTKKLINKRKDV